MWIVWLFNQALFTGIFPCSQAAWEHQFFPLVSAVSTFDRSPAHPAAPQPPCWGEGWLMLSSINSNAQNPGVQGQPCLLTGHPQGCLEGLRSNIWGSKHFPPVLFRATVFQGAYGHEATMTAFPARPCVPERCHTYVMKNYPLFGELGNTISSTSTLMNPCLSCERKLM